MVWIWPTREGALSFQLPLHRLQWGNRYLTMPNLRYLRLVDGTAGLEDGSLLWLQIELFREYAGWVEVGDAHLNG